MKGVILAGGKGERLYPLTKVTNKHLLPVGKEPMIYNPIKQLLSCGIRDILIVTSKKHMGDIVGLLGSGEEFGCDFTFKVQEKAGGIAHALALAEDFSKGQKIIVILGDNILAKSIRPYAEKFEKQDGGAMILLKKVGDPERYGVAAMDEKNNMVMSIAEKEKNPKSDYAVTGVYMYDPDVFDIIAKIKPSKRGELEITSVNNQYINEKKMTYEILDSDWTDAGTFESLAQANQMMLKTGNNLLEG